MIPPRPRKPEPTLLEATEKLIKKLVKQAGRGSQVTDKEGKRRTIPPDILDQVRAADSALKFLQMKHKIDPEEREGEFQRAAAAYHGQGEGNADHTEGTGNGYASPH